MYLQPQTFKARMLRSQMSMGARLVGMLIADERFRRRLKPHEPLPVDVPALARDCNKSENSVRMYLAECIDSGWIESHEVHRDGKQRPNECRLTEPAENRTTAPVRRRPLLKADRERLAAGNGLPPETTPTDTRPLVSETASTDTNSQARTDTNGLVGVLRSKYLGARAADGPKPVAESRDDKAVPQPAPVQPVTQRGALALVPVMTDHQPEDNPNSTAVMWTRNDVDAATWRLREAQAWLAKTSELTGLNINANSYSLAVATSAITAGYTADKALDALVADGHNLTRMDAGGILKLLDRLPIAGAPAKRNPASRTSSPAARKVSDVFADLDDICDEHYGALRKHCRICKVRAS